MNTESHNPIDGAGASTTDPAFAILNPPKKDGKGYAILSLILGLAGILFSTIFFPLFYIVPLLGGLSVLFAILSKKRDGKLSRIALIGLIIGILALLLFVVLFLITTQITLHFQSMSTDEFNQFFEDTFGITHEEFVESIYGIDYEEYLQQYGKLPVE